MNLMGKILTLLILFLSTSFLVIAVMVGAAHRNWKAVAAKNKQTADQAQLVLETARTNSTDMEKKLNAERVARTMQLSQLESQLTVARQQRDDKEAQLTAEFIISQERLDRMKAAELRLAEQDTEVKDLRSTNKNLVDDIATQRKSVVNLTNQLYQSRGAESSMKKLNEEVNAQLARQIKVLEHYGLTQESLTAHIPPSVKGMVAKVRENFIAISIGTDDGIRVGHEVDIYREGRYIGKATITKADFNMSAARLNADYMQAPVEEGDNVTTKF